MRSLQQFRPALYLVLTLTALGYGIALESPVNLIVGLVLIALSHRLHQGGMTIALPRWASSLLAILAGVWSVAGLLQGSMSTLMAISQWLYYLLLVILWTRQDNRAYAQMLVMSLMVMLSGAINSASVLFGLLFIAYLLTSLYCCLLFHLKVESEQAVRSYGLEHVAASEGTRAEMQFGRSMRRLTALVSMFAVAMGVFVFMIFPRASAPGLIMRLQSARAAPLTGFSERVSFDRIARITQNTQTVAHVAVSSGETPVTLPEIYLRGMTLDRYTGRATGRGRSWQWIHNRRILSHGSQQRVLAGTTAQLGEPEQAGSPTYRQRITLQPTGASTLFAMDGVTSFSPVSDMDLVYLAQDGSIRLREPSGGAIQYEVESTGILPQPVDEPVMPLEPSPFLDFGEPVPPDMELAGSRIDPKIAEYALRPEVSGSNDKGPLALQRTDSRQAQAIDEEIAASIARHLSSQFSYTLDLSDVRRNRSADPIVEFLYDFRRGHCEYFAGAMALLCQSLGIQSRVTIGFRAGPEDYNAIGQYYVIRQSHAHAWVEVLTTSGWRRFDPTPATQYFAQRGGKGWLKSVSDVFDYVQYQWARSVVTYGNSDRRQLWENVETGFSKSVSEGSQFMRRLREQLRPENLYLMSSRLLTIAIGAALLVLIVAIAIFVAEKRRLYRRAERIGLSSLPGDEQLRLARKLGFYDELLLLLNRNQIRRPPEMTPREFASSLSYLPPDAYNNIRAITEIYYRVRYGRRELQPAQRRRLYGRISAMASTLTASRLRVQPTAT